MRALVYRCIESLLAPFQLDAIIVYRCHDFDPLQELLAATPVEVVDFSRSYCNRGIITNYATKSATSSNAASTESSGIVASLLATIVSHDA